MEIENRYQTLYTITKTLNSQALDVGLHHFVESVTKAVNAKGCSLMLFTPDKQQLIHTVSYGLSNDYIEKGPVYLDAIISEVLKGHVVKVLNADREPWVQYKEKTIKEGIVSMLSIPLAPQGEIIGIMRVYTAEPRQFSNDEIDFLSCLADVGAIFFQKTRVCEALGKSLDERCKELAEMAEERNRFLRFLGIAAHDLKAPLTAIQSYFGVMLGGFSGELNEKQRSMIERCSLRITELLNLISNLLDIPRIETGQLIQEMKECSLHELINNCFNEMSGLAAQKGIILKKELPENLSQINGSSARLQQVITNLVSNSINYTTEGEVIIRAKENAKEVQVDIIDSGIGIPSDDLPHIFTDFYRGSNVKTKGTGLGLSISKRIIEAHGGRIGCESPYQETNTGSRFFFVLPKLCETERRQS